MILWLDAQVSPKLCPWMRREFGIDVVPVRDLGLREAEDRNIFVKARQAGTVVLTKDEDFALLVKRLGPPPQVIWLTCGNVSNASLKKILVTCLPEALVLIRRGEAMVEISAARERRHGRTSLDRKSRRKPR